MRDILHRREKLEIARTRARVLRICVYYENERKKQKEKKRKQIVLPSSSPSLSCNASLCGVVDLGRPRAPFPSIQYTTAQRPLIAEHFSLEAKHAMHFLKKFLEKRFFF